MLLKLLSSFLLLVKNLGQNLVHKTIVIILEHNIDFIYIINN